MNAEQTRGAVQKPGHPPPGLVPLWLYVVLLLSSFALISPPVGSERSFPESDYTLQPPFLAAWERAGGAPALGLPRSAPLWLDGQTVQLFDRALLALPTEPAERTGRTGRRPRPADVAITRQDAGWLASLPPALLQQEPAPYRANLRVVGSAAPPPVAPVTTTVPLAAPLQPLTLTLDVAAYSGPAVVYLLDMRLLPTRRITVEVQATTPTTFTLEPRGRPGQRWALVAVQGQLAGVWSGLFTMQPTTAVQTGQAAFDRLYPMIYDFMQQDVVSYTLDGRLIRGYRSPDNPQIWLRDHVYQGRGFRYFEHDMTSVLDAFAAAQQPDGSFPDVLDYPAKGIIAHRLEPESDLEFLFVQGVYDAWQATGDDAWLRGKLPAMRRGLAYITSDPLRWNAELGLVRRPFTIDTWDFSYGPTTLSPDGQPAPRHWIDDETVWGIFHGDNTGLAYAMRLMHRMESHLGNNEQAAFWEAEWRALMQRLDDLSWNGDFYTHFVPEAADFSVPGVDMAAQLSLSNAYALNREVLDVRQSRAIIASYFARRDFERAFAEWYSIDPPFPPGSFGMGGKKGENPGEYVNGGIMPLVGGELARGAFRHGNEAYGFDILRRYAELIRLTGATYLWYYPTGQAGISGPDTLATDGWGASAMLGALLEGAAGIEDISTRYRQVEISPRWSAVPDIENAWVVARYGPSGPSTSYIAYRWQRHTSPTSETLVLDVTGTWQQARLRLLLPETAPDDEAAVRVLLDGSPLDAGIRKVASSRYVIVEATSGDAVVEVSWPRVQ